MPICAEGHASTAEDYCDVCGAPMGSSTAAATTPPPVVSTVCPACGASINGRFCETCGHDSALPAPTTPVQAPVTWTAVVRADREFYDRVVARGGPDTVDYPQFFPERRITLQGDTALIGRHNRDHGVTPEIDLGLQPADRGVSTQHAVLRIRDTGPTVTDLGSTNGTSLNGGEELLAENVETPLSDGDRIHVGAWTTITITTGSGQ
ncbi:FHA domain-containing protein [Mycobacterium sp. NPDC006124]|uniref:FHA domain-containing protein n=1 Tax=Mycobacterium sp. NPDC006124 TaxID=3156729 RepID=UPI0033A1BAC4